jgi:hypothetical protein
VNDRRGVYIPPEIWNLDGLSIPERVLLAEIAFLASNGACFASNNHFGRLLGCSASNARKMVYKLVDAGFVLRVSKSGHDQRVLCPNPTVAHVQNWTTPCPKPDTIKDKVKTKPKKQQGTTRPNLDMCVEWFTENGFPQYAEPFFDYYETNGWVQGGGKKPIRNWEAAARGWVRRQKQFNDEKRQRGFDKLKFNADNIKSWANQKNDGHDVGR